MSTGMAAGSISKRGSFMTHSSAERKLEVGEGGGRDWGGSKEVRRGYFTQSGHDDVSSPRGMKMGGMLGGGVRLTSVCEWYEEVRRRVRRGSVKAPRIVAL